MRLSYDDICRVAHGVARIEKTQDSIRFYRFTRLQQETYLLESSDDFYKKTFATSGIRLYFTTDSQFLRLHCRMTKASSRTFAWFDVYENDIMIAHFGGDTAQPLESHADIALSAGEKKVEIHFPWSAAGEILDMEVEDGAFLYPVKRGMTMLAFGDSITQGYDAQYPSLTYTSRLSDMLNASCINKGIGGERFFPELLDSGEDIEPDLITVAYGTNDWSKRDPEAYEDHCRRFFQKLTIRYPKVKIAAITPTWRADLTKQTPFGAPLWEAVKLIERVCSDFSSVTVIHGGSLTPRLGEFYSDNYLHPNDICFGLYAQKLYPLVCDILRK